MTEVLEALRDLRSSLAWPDDDADLTGRALSDVGRRRPHARWPYVAAAAAVVAIGAGVPAAAHLFGVDGVRITRLDVVPDELGTTLDLGRPTAVRADSARPPALGEPDAAFEGRPDGGYTEVWSTSGGTVLLTRFPGSLDAQVIEKRVFGAGTVEGVTVRGAPAYWVSGPHGFLYLGPDGAAREDTVRLSGNALLWTLDGLTFRLESDRDLTESVELAESMFDEGG